MPILVITILPHFETIQYPYQDFHHYKIQKTGLWREGATIFKLVAALLSGSFSYEISCWTEQI